jgi:predicted nucleic acid-binding protein
VKILFDTSVLVAAMVESHPQHPRALSWLAKVRSGEIELLVSSHTLAELYSVLSAFPIKPRISPATVQRMIQENVGALATLVSLSGSDYLATLEKVSALGLSGGIVYDALIARAAQTSNAERLLTLNQKHFRLVWPEGESLLLSP